MKHIVAFDVSMGKSTMVIYDRYRRCEFDGEIEHIYSAFKALNSPNGFDAKTKDG